MSKIILFVALLIVLTGCQAKWEYQSRSIYGIDGEIIGKREYSVFYWAFEPVPDHPPAISKPEFEQKTNYVPVRLQTIWQH